jgi:hypothetical protein
MKRIANLMALDQMNWADQYSDYGADYGDTALNCRPYAFFMAVAEQRRDKRSSLSPQRRAPRPITDYGDSALNYRPYEFSVAVVEQRQDKPPLAARRPRQPPQFAVDLLTRPFSD